jgi:ATP phosphoribosyltransferase regulatory subunit
MIALAGAALAAAEIGDVTIDVGHVALARGALAGMGPEIQELVARKDRGGLERAVGSSPAAAVLVALPGLYGEAADVFARARALPLDDTMARAVDELEAALELAREQGFAGRLTVDLGEIRGSGYYTGIRFAAYVDGVGDAVLTGGRYDDLVGRYGRAARATGFAVDVEAIAQAEHARGGEPSPAARGVVVACPGDPRSAARVAAALRRRNLRVAVDLARREDDAALLAYLAERGARAAVVCDRGGARLLPGAKAISPTAVERAEAGDATLLAAEIVAARTGELTDGRGGDRRRPVGRRGQGQGRRPLHRARRHGGALRRRRQRRPHAGRRRQKLVTHLIPSGVLRPGVTACSATAWSSIPGRSSTRSTGARRAASSPTTAIW